MIKCLLANVLPFVLFFALLVGCAGPPVELKEVFYPPAPDTPRLQFLMTFSRESDFQETSALEDWILGPDLVFDGLGRPYDLATVRGKIFVHDRKYSKVFVVDLNKRTLDFIEDDKDREGTLKYPGGIFVEPDGTKYIADMERGEIVVLDAGDNFVRTYGGEGILSRPTDVALYKNKLYVCDIQKQQILVLDKDTGELVFTIGESGREPGQFTKPTHVIVDDNGMVYVSDTLLGRVTKFDGQGNYSSTFGVLSDVTGGMVRPKGIAVDRENRLYVVDAASQVVQIFRDDVQLLLYFGGASYDRGGLSLPAGIALDYDNVEYFREFIDKDLNAEYLVYVTNLDGPNKINVYAYGTWTGSESAVELEEPPVEDNIDTVRE